MDSYTPYDAFRVFFFVNNWARIQASTVATKRLTCCIVTHDISSSSCETFTLISLNIVDFARMKGTGC
jgi:hypothetical protein